MNPKAIGSNYEREIARLLSRWISGKDDPLICWRNVHSGTISTCDKKKGLSGANTEGDFQCLDLKYSHIFDLFCFDSKCYKECNPYFINSKNMKSNAILNQWIKVCEEAGNKIPVMICKIRDRKAPEFIVLPLNMRIPNQIKSMTYTFWDDKIKDCVIYLLDEFLEKINAQELYECNKKILKEI